MIHYNRNVIKFYCGVDLHKNKSYIYVINLSGDKVESREIPTNGKSFEEVFSPYPGGVIVVAVEISSLTFWLCDVLDKLGVWVYVVNTLENSYVSESVKKTDKEDARKLAIQLWKEILPKPVYIPKKEEREIRRLVSQRHYVVKNLTRVINRTSHLLANYEIKFSRRALTCSKRWQMLQESLSEGSRPPDAPVGEVSKVRKANAKANAMHPRCHRRLSSCSCSRSSYEEENEDMKGKVKMKMKMKMKVELKSELKVDDVLLTEFTIQHEQFKLFQSHISQTEDCLLSKLKASPRLYSMYEKLLTIPGMGFVTSSALIGCIGDIQRFKSGRQMVSYLGLCPKVRESGGKSLSDGSITKRGNNLLRGYFIQAAMGTIGSRKSNAQVLKKWYEKIREKKGWRKARVALARKLATIAFGVLKTNSPYDPSKVAMETDTDTDTDTNTNTNRRIQEYKNTRRGGVKR